MAVISAKWIDKPNFGSLKIDFTELLNDAVTICKLDIQKHITGAKRIDTEGPLKALAPATVATKSRAKAGWQYAGSKLTVLQAANMRRHASHPLQATENLLYNQKITKASKGNQRSTIEIGPTREKIYWEYNEAERPVFGISNAVLGEIDKMVAMRLVRILAGL